MKKFVELTNSEIRHILQSLPRPFVFQIERGDKAALLWKRLDAKLSAALKSKQKVLLDA
jgi:hypothetical protein